MPSNRESMYESGLLVNNVNSWGNVQYNMPLRTSANETRTATNIASRHIPDVVVSVDCRIKKALPTRVCGRDKIVDIEGYKTTSSDYCVKASYNNANEKSDKGINCKNVLFMTGVEKRLMAQNIRQPVVQSEVQERYRGEVRPDTLSSPRPPDPDFIYDIVASGRNEAPVIPETASGFRRLLDPYLTTYRHTHRPFTADDQYGIGAKDHITFYSDSNTPKVRGFGPKYKEIWMPLQATRKKPVQDKTPFTTEYHGISGRHETSWIKNIFRTETSSNYRVPYAVSRVVTWEPVVAWPLAPFKPNPWQTTTAPAMYCTEYCHVAQGTGVNRVVDQLHKQRVQEECKKKYIVSRDFC